MNFAAHASRCALRATYFEVQSLDTSNVPDKLVSMISSGSHAFRSRRIVQEESGGRFQNQAGMVPDSAAGSNAPPHSAMAAETADIRL